MCFRSHEIDVHQPTVLILSLVTRLPDVYSVPDAVGHDFIAANRMWHKNQQPPFTRSPFCTFNANSRHSEYYEAKLILCLLCTKRTAKDAAPFLMNELKWIEICLCHLAYYTRSLLGFPCRPLMAFVYFPQNMFRSSRRFPVPFHDILRFGSAFISAYPLRVAFPPQQADVGCLRGVGIVKDFFRFRVSEADNRLIAAVLLPPQQARAGVDWGKIFMWY